MNKIWRHIDSNLVKRLLDFDVDDIYDVSTNGEVRSSLTFQTIQERLSQNGYTHVPLLEHGCDIRYPKYRPVDDIVGLMFLDIPNDLKEKHIKIHHINGDFSDNDISNLEWVEDIEEWVKIEGFNRYSISSWCRVKRNTDSLIIKPWISKHGYEYVDLINDIGCRKKHILHRLYMSTFNPIPNMDNFQVNHIDENKRNNYYKNLEWLTAKENTNFGSHNDRAIANGVPTKKPVKCVELNMIFDSLTDAANFAINNGGYSSSLETAISNIRSCCNGNPKYTKAYKFRWEWVR